MAATRSTCWGSAQVSAFRRLRGKNDRGKLFVEWRPGHANTVLVEGLALDLAQMNGPSFVLQWMRRRSFASRLTTFSAEFGRSAGAVSLQRQVRDQSVARLRLRIPAHKVLNANNFFQNRAGNARPTFIQNQFGGSAGGPIKKDKTFFFANWEEYRNRQVTRASPAFRRSAARWRFSQTRNSAGNIVLIADPTTTRRLEDGSYTRDLFAGNLIPASESARWLRM